MAKAPSGKKSLGGKKLVIVESPTKARTIKKFLDSNYIVESCMGHVRDLPQSAKDIPEKIKKEPWANLGVNVDKHFEPLYLVPKNKTKIVSALKEKLEGVTELILATDEDREGESISWHLVNVLKPKVPIRRMVFNEITEEAIQDAVKDFREIDMNLVKAQEARRVLDRLVGYTISPLLWKKVAYGLSAGRVQSVAVRLVCEREHERIKFKKSEYWDLTAKLNAKGVDFEAKINQFKGQKIASGKDFDPDTGKLIADKKDILALDEKQANDVLNSIKGKDFVVSSVEEKPQSRKPAPPFITSTLQQESNRKLGLGARETMQVAQRLYERGLITYMRTDSMFLSEQAVDAARKQIGKLYGKNFVPEKPRDYGGKKVKGAQEAHEAIRPSGKAFVSPDDAGLSGVELKVYDLIWRRTLASQMPNSEHKQMSIRMDVGDAVFNASGMTIEFAGFLKVYIESDDDADAANPLGQTESQLPQLKKTDKVKAKDIATIPHETKPPARFTEASLVQALEKQGIGRPSTYAAIISTIQDRGYVRKNANALVPTFTAMVVTKLLSQHFPEYVDYDFTSAMEKSLDDIASGDLESETYLASIYLGEKGLRSLVAKREKSIDGDEARGIKLEGLKNFVFRVGRYGAYVCRTEKGEEICASIPDNHFPGDMTSAAADKLIEQKVHGADSIGKDPETDESVYVLSGRYGPYVQRGEYEGEESKPKRMALPAGLEPEKVTLDQAVFLLSMPRTIGKHPELKKEIKLGIGRFGPYVVCDGDYRSVPKTDDFFSVTLPRALELFAQPKKGRGRAAPLKELGNHPGTKEPIQLMNGKFGPYVKCGKVNVSLPEDKKPEDVDLALALALLSAKLGDDTPPPKAKKAAKGSKPKKKVKSKRS